MRFPIYFLLGIFLVVAAPVWSQTHLWSAGYGDTGFDVGFDSVVDSDGNTIVVGTFEGTVDFGGGPLASAGSQDIFAAKYSSTGVHQWSLRAGDFSQDQGHGIAVDALGNVLITGFFEGTIDLGGGPITSIMGSDLFVAKYDANGKHIWSRGFGADNNNDFGRGISVDASGSVFATGCVSDTVDFGGGPLGGAGNIFLVKFDSNANHLWSQRFGGPSTELGLGVVADGNGNVVITGYFEDSIDFGGGVLTSAGSRDIFVAAFDTTGAHLWSKAIGGIGQDEGASVDVDASGNVFCVGFFVETVDFGGGPLTVTGFRDVFLVKYDGGGTHQWSKRFGDIDFDYGYDVSTDHAGNAFITGSFVGTVDFGGGEITSEGSSDIFVAGYDGDGNHLWSRGIASGSGQGVAAGADKVSVTGRFEGTVDFGGGPLTSNGSADIFVAYYGPIPSPAVLQSFESSWRDDHVEVSWRLIDVTGELSFDIYRSDGNGVFSRVYDADVLDESGDFVFLDQATEPDRFYRYRVIVFEDGEAVTSFETQIKTAAAILTLGQNAPNPFNPETMIPFVINEAGPVSLAVYDISGRLVRMLVDGEVRAGPHTETWDGRDANGARAASGIYFYRLSVGQQSLTRKAALLE